MEICRNSLLFRCNKLPDSPCVHARVQGSNGPANLENAVSIGESASTKQYSSPTLQEGTVTHVSNFKFLGLSMQELRTLLRNFGDEKCRVGEKEEGFSLSHLLVLLVSIPLKTIIKTII